MSSPSLPFLLQPQREFREIGEPPHTLRIPLYGKIRLREALLIREEEFTGAFLEEAARLAEAIIESQAITELGVADLMAVRILSRLLGGKEPPTPEEEVAMVAHADLLRQAGERLGEVYRQQQLRAITAMVQFRLGVLDWTDSQSVILTDEVQQAILQVVEDERAAAGGSKDEREVLEQLAESLGKHAAALMPPQDPPAPTGESSTGDSASTGPTTPTPARSASRTSRARRSSRPSSRASGS